MQCIKTNVYVCVCVCVVYSTFLQGILTLQTAIRKHMNVCVLYTFRIEKRKNMEEERRKKEEEIRRKKAEEEKRKEQGKKCIFLSLFLLSADCIALTFLCIAVALLFLCLSVSFPLSLFLSLSLSLANSSFFRSSKAKTRRIREDHEPVFRPATESCPT